MAAQVDGGVVTPAPMTTPTPVPEINSYTVGVIVAVVGNIAVSFSYQVCLPRGGGMLSSAPPFEVKQQSERVSRPLQTSPAARSHARTHAHTCGPGGSSWHDPSRARSRLQTRRESNVSFLNLENVSPSILGNTAFPLQFQKLAHKNNVDKKPYTSLPLWWLGLALMLGGEVGNFLAYGWAPATVRHHGFMLRVCLCRKCVAAQLRDIVSASCRQGAYFGCRAVGDREPR